MQAFFYGLARQSLTAGWMILALLALRPLLKKVPRAFSCLLWALAAVRLVLPFSLESKMSLVPQQIAAPTQITPIVANIPMAQPALQAAAPAAAQGITWQEALPILWLVGVAAMAIYALISYIRILNRVSVSIRIKDRLYICDNVRSPFILGIFRPRIYLPSDLTQPVADYVLAHERAHLRRGDHLWKPLGFFLLSIYWFNPLCWVAYLLFCRDIEQACDEAVIKNMTPGDKKAYSAALLQCSLPGHAIAACPLAFGEVGVKQRIRGVLNYRKPALWVVTVSAVLCVVLAACFLTDPVEAAGENTEQSTQEGKQAGNILHFNLETIAYSAPDFASQELEHFPEKTPISILRQERFGDSIWGIVECENGELGYIYLDEFETALSDTLSPTIYDGTGEQNSFTQQTVIYVSPSQQARELAKAEAGETYYLLRREPIAGSIWAYVECQDGKTFGWILLGTEEAASAQAATEQTPMPDEEYITYPREVTVYSAPDQGSRELARYPAGMPVSLDGLEVVEGSIWGYVKYQDGETLGWISLEEIMDAFTNRQSSFSLQTTIYSSPSRQARQLGQGEIGEVYLLKSMEPFGNNIWGYIEYQKENTTILGWILLDEGEAPLPDLNEVPLCSGTVNAEMLNVRSGPGTMNSAVGSLKRGTTVSIFEIVTSDNLEWGRISGSGWVCMRYIEHGVTASGDSDITYSSGSKESTESYTFSQETNVYSSPSEQGRVVAQTAAGEVGTITRREFIADGSWGYVQLRSGSIMGWVHFVEEDEALAYFRGYVEACSQPTPEAAEEYLFFSTEYAREFFRVMYQPVTGWYPSGIFRVNSSLWGIEFSDTGSGRMVYCFVGRMGGRLYVFQNVHQVPQALSENLEAARYEEEDAMYITEEYMECDSVIRRLLPFAQPKYVTIEGTKDDFGAASYPIEDVICGTDTWRVVDQPGSYGSPGCIIRLTAADGSVATICDSSPVVTVSGPGGAQQYFQAAYTGEELVGIIYSWAQELASAG